MATKNDKDGRCLPMIKNVLEKLKNEKPEVKIAKNNSSTLPAGDIKIEVSSSWFFILSFLYNNIGLQNQTVACVD